MTPDTEPANPAAPPRKKPHLSFLLATSFGLGYLPKAPGTWGSLAGLALVWPLGLLLSAAGSPKADFHVEDWYFVVHFHVLALLCILVAALGVLVSSRVAAYSGMKDPQYVVVDEVSGQMLTLLLGGFSAATHSFGTAIFNPGASFYFDVPWKFLLTGFILFRLFDIWKPFPIRKLEKLPGGWGIMADDWLAGIYAAILLRLALHFNLL
jgi:phosphatidylglycerophosphatase A